jgi:hypothetical protein
MGEELLAHARVSIIVETGGMLLTKWVDVFVRKMYIYF